MILEVVVFNFQSAVLAAEAGADRLELCDNYYEGGTTPSHGNTIALVEKLDVPVFPMVRPRGGDFLYNDEELSVMENEINFFKEIGCKGVVLGCLNRDGTVNSMALARFNELAYPLEVTFHRAFDRVNDRYAALDEIVACGCKRILTSGGMPTAAEGFEIIRYLNEYASGRIILIPGGGINSSNIGLLIDVGCIEYHSPARKMVPSTMSYFNEMMNENLEFSCIDSDEIKRMLLIMNRNNGSEIN